MTDILGIQSLTQGLWKTFVVQIRALSVFYLGWQKTCYKIITTIRNIKHIKSNFISRLYTHWKQDNVAGILKMLPEEIKLAANLLHRK